MTTCKVSIISPVLQMRTQGPEHFVQVLTGHLNSSLLIKSSTPSMIPELIGSSSLPHSKPTLVRETLTENLKTLETSILWPPATSGGY